MKERKLCFIWALFIQCCFFASALIFRGVPFLPNPNALFYELSKTEYDWFMHEAAELSDFQNAALGIFEILSYILYFGSAMILLYLLFSKAKGLYVKLPLKAGIICAGLLGYFAVQGLISFYVSVEMYRYYMTMLPLVIVSLVIIALALAGKKSGRT